MHSPTNCYLVSLAAADCVVLIASVPNEILSYYVIGSQWIWGPAGCAIFVFLQNLGKCSIESAAACGGRRSNTWGLWGRIIIRAHPHVATEWLSMVFFFKFKWRLAAFAKASRCKFSSVTWLLLRSYRIKCHRGRKRRRWLLPAPSDYLHNEIWSHFSLWRRRYIYI